MLCKWGLQFGGTHADPRHHPTELAERRVRMAVGLKRYFHGKRLEGLLSSRVRALPAGQRHACPPICRTLCQRSRFSNETSVHPKRA